MRTLIGLAAVIALALPIGAIAIDIRGAPGAHREAKPETTVEPEKAVQMPAPEATTPAPPALMLIEAEITDMTRFRSYTQAIIPIVQKFGGRYLVMRGAREDVEGDWGATRIVVSEWPNMDRARAFWNSPEYREAVKLRAGTGTFRVTLLETMPSTAPAATPPPMRPAQ